MSKVNTQKTQEHVQGSAAAVWWLTGTVCLALFGAIFWFSGPGRTPADTSTRSTLTIPVPVGMAWPALTIDREALDASRAKQRADWNRDASHRDLSERKEVQDLLEVVKLINDHQFATHPIPSRTMESLEHDLTIALSGILEVIKPEEFIHLGGPIFEKCEEGLAIVQREIAAGTITLEQAIEDADFERHELYRKHCGNMLQEFKKRGLIDARGQWVHENAAQLGTVLERYRWAHLLHLYVEPLAQLTELERTIFVRWRVEDPEAFDLPTRRRFVPDLYRYLPTYPKGVPEAMLSYEAGERKQAAEILSRYRNQAPDAPTYSAMYEALVKELSE